MIAPAAGDFIFDCSSTPDFTEKRLRITNNSNIGNSFYGASLPVPAPLYSLSPSSFRLEPGQSSTALGIGMGSGACTAGTGAIGVGSGSAHVCSMTPSTTLQVRTVP